ncbi:MULTISPECIES: hypothetical protein [Streptomyces]|uniref:hypothetical protein n=1 Tax=Streptomyces lycopersici TaxID=2974589 RepID=UPI0021D0C982|nr:hypothetical protein [Streptomyces sp. NEAU-383]
MTGVTARHYPPPITTDDARAIADHWHTGPGSALHGIAATGRTPCRARAQNEISFARLVSGDPVQRLRLTKLRAWVDAQRTCTDPGRCLC